MDYKVKLDEWLTRNELARLEYLAKAKDLLRKWQQASMDARNQSKYANMTVDSYSVVKGWYKKEIKAAILLIDSKEYLNSIYPTANGFDKFFKDNNCQVLNKGDTQLLKNYNMDEIITRVKKETLAHKASLLARTTKILGGEPVEVQDFGWTLHLFADNGKKAKMWAVEAGGYNIQCYHLRVLVKEMK